MLRQLPLTIKEWEIYPYEVCLQDMRSFTDNRTQDTKDALWILEHPAVYTLGQAGEKTHVLDPGAIPVVASDRGGQVTYHGPGQLIGYCLFDLKRLNIDVKTMITNLEEVIIQLLAHFSIQGHRLEHMPGVYVANKKIASLGIRVRHGCTYHGFSLNTHMDLSPFNGINTCGYPTLQTTQLSEYTKVDLPTIRHQIKREVINVFGFKDPYAKKRANDKVKTLPVRLQETKPALKKPHWIRVKAPINSSVTDIKQRLRKAKLHSVCEEASCPNLTECFSHGTATFMIMGDKCTRRCAFCDVAHGRPDPLDKQEPQHLAETVNTLGLSYVVITSVDRDDLKDGGAAHFVDCMQAVRQKNPKTTIEILVPDFKKCMLEAIEILKICPPDVFNHNIETVPRLYRTIRPGSSFEGSLALIKQFKRQFPKIPTKSGLMVGLGETDEEIIEVLQTLREAQCDRLTLGQYLQPSPFHAEVERYVHPDRFEWYASQAKSLGFEHVASGPMVRSSYHADLQHEGKLI